MSSPDRPDVLLITIDQWRADSLGCAGHPVAVTPNLDALAASGLRFTRHYAQTTPCGPSRASILTGTYLHTHRVGRNGTPLDRRFTNLALEMNEAGYRSTLFGYTDTAVDPRTVDDPADPRLFTYEGVLPGFTVEVNLPEHLGAWGEWLRGRGYDVPDGEVPETMHRQEPAEEGDRHDPPTVYASDDSEAAFLAEVYGDWLDRQDPTEPLFAHLTFLRPHPPYMAPAPWNTLIDPDDVPPPVAPATAEEEAAVHPMVAGALQSDVARAPDDPEAVRRLRATYWGMLAEVDEKVGRVLAHLDRTGRRERTLVIVTADHGEQLGDHHLIQKLGYHESSYHVPLIVAGPGVATAVAGGTVDRFTESVDLMPTVLDAVGAPIPVQCQGAPLTPFLRGEQPDRWRDAAHWEWDFRNPLVTLAVGLPLTSSNLAVLRDEDGKYVHFAGFPPLFFDLRHDPHELHDLAGDPSAAARVASYAQRLLDWRMRQDDETLASVYLDEDGPHTQVDPPTQRL